MHYYIGYAIFDKKEVNEICSESIWLFWKTCGQVLGLYSFLIIVTLIAVASLVFNIWGYKRLTLGKRLVFLKLMNKEEKIKVEEENVNSGSVNNKPLIVFLSLLCLMLFASLIAIWIAHG